MTAENGRRYIAGDAEHAYAASALGGADFQSRSRVSAEFSAVPCRWCVRLRASWVLVVQLPRSLRLKIIAVCEVAPNMEGVDWRFARSHAGLRSDRWSRHFTAAPLTLAVRPSMVSGTSGTGCALDKILVCA
jgi:hypothetical protein